MSLQKLEEGLAREDDAAEDKWREEKEGQKSELEAMWDKERQTLIAAHDEVVKGLEAALSSNDVNGKAALHAVEKERIRLEVELEAEKKDRHTQVSALSIQHAEELEKLHKEHQAGIIEITR